MTKYFTLQGAFNEELLNRFIDFANSSNEHDWELPIISQGGKTSVYETIMRIINNKESEKPGSCVLVASYICSSAFSLFLEAKCTKKMFFGAYGLAHCGFSPVETTSNGVVRYNIDRAWVQTTKECFPQELAIMQKVLTKKEIAMFEKGEDVELSFNRLRKMFPDAEII